MGFRQEALEELVKKEPFTPFRIVTASGKEYPVNDPHLVVVMQSDVFYAFPKRDRWTTIPLVHITSVEVGQPA